MIKITLDQNPDHASCENCQAFDPDSYHEKNTSGKCRRNPPVLTDSVYIKGEWPVVKNDDWCCEWSVLSITPE